MKFAKLTNPDGFTVYVNPALVTAICRITGDTTTGVEVSTGTHWEVKETSEQVVAALEAAASTPSLPELLKEADECSLELGRCNIEELKRLTDMAIVIMNEKNKT